MPVKFVQANLNTSRPSLNLLLHYARETETGILLISEPNHVPTTDNWFSSQDGKAAIFIDPRHARANCNIFGIGFCFVAVNYGAYFSILIYISPNFDLYGYNDIMDKLSATILHRSNKVIICGDFNTKASL